MGGIGIVIMIVVRVYVWVMVTAVRLTVWLAGKLFLLLKRLVVLLARGLVAAATAFREFGGWLAKKWTAKRRAWKDGSKRNAPM